MTDDLQLFIDDFNIIDNALCMRDLQRWNGRSLRKTENLSEHTHLVVACAIELYDEYKKYIELNFEELIRVCMLHDALEIHRGDILSVTKDAIPGLRDITDSEENIFIQSILQNKQSDNTIIFARYADLYACFKFIENELKYPSNDFSYKAYEHGKRKLQEYKRFVHVLFGIKDKDDIIVTNRFYKGYDNDAGTDILLTEDVVFLPHKTTMVNLKVTVTPKQGEMAVLCARTSAAVKGLTVAMCPIDTDYVGDVTAIVSNTSNSIIEYKKGQAFCQCIFVQLSNTQLDNTIIKNKGKRTDGKIGSTGI